MIIVLGFVIPYVLLLTGGLSGVVRSLVSTFANDGDTSVDVYGFASGILFGTRADSVVVRNSRGLKVIVSDITVTGNISGYLTGTGLENVHADSLGITVAAPPEGPETGEPVHDMSMLFRNILKGFVTDVDTLSISRGMIVDHEGVVIIDSMSISGRVFLDDSAGMEVFTGGVLVPDFGYVSGSGTVTLTEQTATLGEFFFFTPSGPVVLSGTLLADSSLSLHGEGSFSTAFIPEALAAQGFYVIDVGGNTTDPSVNLAIADGSILLLGREVYFSSDSLTGDMKELSSGEVHFHSDGISGVVSGALVFQGTAWSGGFDLEFSGIDPAAWDSMAPSGLLTGTLAASVEGVGGIFSSGNLELELEESSVEGYSLDGLHLIVYADPSRIEGSISADVQGTTVNSDWVVSLGEGYRPVSWSAEATVNSPDSRGLLRYIDPEGVISSLSGVSARLSASGNQERFRIVCDARAGSIRINEITASDLFLLGDATVDISPENGVRVGFDGSSGIAGLSSGNVHLTGVLVEGALALGLPLRGEPTVQFLGTALVDSAASAGFLALGSMLDADVSFSDGLPSGELRLRSDSIETPNGNMSLGLRAESRDGVVHIDSLEILHEQGARVVAVLSADLSGDSFSVELDSLRITMNKLRLVRAGGAELTISPDGTVGVDTLWLDPPAGFISGSGSLGPDGGIDASFNAGSVDIASLGLVLGLDLPVSGVFNIDVEARGHPGALEAFVHASVDDPTFGSWTQGDSITVDASLSGGDLVVDGIWIWSQGVRSGVSLTMDHVWNGTTIDLSLERLVSLEAELTGIGDWLLYILPFPVMTSGASISSRIEYSRDEPYLSANLAGHFQRLFIAGAQLEFPMSSIYVSYPDESSEDDYNASFRITSGQGRNPALTAELRAELLESIPLRTGEVPVELAGYDFNAELNGWETILSGLGWVSLSGNLSATSSEPGQRPLLRGKISLDEGVIALQSQQTASVEGGESAQQELPFDLYIAVQAERGLWLRSSYMNIELAADITVLTQDRQPVYTGNISVVRGTVSVLNKDFRITSGSVEIIQGTPPGFMLNILAEARVRSSMSREVYTIEVNVTGDPENPEIALSGSGVSGELTNEDIVTLLTLGVTYGEMQQMDTGALETELESVTQGMLGNMIARSIREGMGFDALSISPDLLSDSTGLTVEVGKYVLPNLYVSYIDDVFSAKPGTISAQYYFNRDIYLEGSSKTTLSGNQEPTIELHYTIRY
ncbi:MAG: translocation/assembly module TamB domain-containing protein [Candidatus Fermentibacteraceae bacterium]